MVVAVSTITQAPICVGHWVYAKCWRPLYVSLAPEQILKTPFREHFTQSVDHVANTPLNRLCVHTLVDKE